MIRRAVAALLLLAAAARTERLPIRTYTVADGIASTNLNCAVRDSRGFLWFCTAEGISRFDGDKFANYTFSGGSASRPGVGRAAVDFLEAGDGSLWVAAPHALCQFNPRPGEKNPLSACYRSDAFAPEGGISRLAEAPGGDIWVLHYRGLFRFVRKDHRFEPIGLGLMVSWTNLLVDTDGSLWLGGEGVLVHRFFDGRVDVFGEADGFPVNARHYFRVSAMLRDHEGRFWVATWQGLCLMTPHPQPGRPAIERVYTTGDGLPGNTIFDVFESRDGVLWVSGQSGLSEWTPGHDPAKQFRSYTAGKGFDLPNTDGPALSALAEDSSGNLWMSGPTRLARNGLVSYGVSDGLSSNQIYSVFEDRQGRLIAISGNSRPTHLNVFDGEAFHSEALRLPPKIGAFTWGEKQIHFQDHTGAWWVATDGGLLRYPATARAEDLAHTLPEHIYTNRDGLPGVDIFRLFEDSRGDVWISIVGAAAVSRWSRAADRIEVFHGKANGAPLDAPIAFAEDRAGNVWMSSYWRNLFRFRNHRLEAFTSTDGLPDTALPVLFVDHAGRLWIGSEGLGRVDDPTAEKPAFRFFGVEAGLSSPSISCITEDALGRIYAGTSRGIDQLDPATGRVRYYGPADGVRAPDRLTSAYRDRQGNLWFGGETLAKLAPLPEGPNRPPPTVRVTAIRAGNRRFPVSELGEEFVGGLHLRPEENALQIGYATLNFNIEESIRFQYRLEGSSQNWSAPTESRTVDYASLAAGSYRFLVRAVNSEGVATPGAASVDFVVLPPLWKRWWFLTLAAAALCFAIFGAHQYRLRQALELERVRTRIAADLHDDIGSSLTQIAILSELARRNGSSPALEGAPPIERIADLSRGLLDSMSDIVWAVNPQRDHLGDLERRMRRFAADLLASRDIDLDFEVPADAAERPLPAEIRRQVFLIYKECIHNAVRHSGCGRVHVTLEDREGILRLCVTDDGRGFTLAAPRDGHGLGGMRRRASEIGGEINVSSEPGGGTVVHLEVRLPSPSALHLFR